MRIVKEAEERKNEILDVAARLFAESGYDNTSTNDILKEIGIARGTLYYHFKSKEEILDTLIKRMADQMVTKARLAVADKSISVLDRITRAMLALNVEEPIGTEVLDQMHKPQNALMHKKSQTYLLKQIVPIFADLAEEGIKQGIFSTEYPKEAAEMILIYSNVAFDDLMEPTPEELQQRMKAFIYHAERILGAEQGSMQLSIQKIFENK